MRLRIARLHHPVHALGPGTRFGIWVQGCSIGCDGCMATDTWPSEAGHEVAVEDVVAQVTAATPLDGVTISGGEPFEQPEALEALVAGLTALRRRRGTDFDILCFSGLPQRRLERDHPAILSGLDALVPEPYLASAGRGSGVGGSANQRTVLLSDRARTRYARSAGAVPLQVLHDQAGVTLIGTPRPGDLARAVERLADAGIDVEEASWLT